ncbi:MAG: hypothetical protein NVS1B7_6670 [Candidatus Saccharimonadales bacterium]
MTKKSQIVHQYTDMIDELKQQRAQSDALFASLGDGAITTDEQGRISRINHVALELLGFKESELIGQWFPRAIVAVDESGKKISPMERPITRAFLDGKHISEKMLYLTKSGKPVPVAITVSPVFLGDKPVGAIEVFRDVSLDHEIDRMKSEFISIASHQLRTPLTAIQTYAHLLASGFKGSLTKGQMEFMEIILSSVDRMNNIITTLLDVSRIEAGKLSVEAKQIDVRELCSTIIYELSQSTKDKNIKLHYAALTEPLLVTTDPLLIAEAYSNLISNAIKYTPELGSVNVSIAVQDNGVLLTVKDNGYGIPKHMQNQIFTKFFRASNVVKRDTTGTGLGLYMVKQIADALKGKVWFTSEENRGTMFYFWIPQ